MEYKWMSRKWLFFRRSHQPAVASPQSDPARDDITSERVTLVEVAPARDDMNALTTQETTQETIQETTEGGNASAPLTEAPEGATAGSSLVASLRQMEGPSLSYMDTQTAADWLAALADISAVTSYKALSYDLLDLKPGQTLADVGCGIGDDARALVERVSPGGEVIGLDASESMIERAIAAGVTPGLRFAVADAAALPLDDGSCDAVRADRMLQHVEDPLQVLREMRRVLKPGGRLVVVEPDWKTMALYPGSSAGGDDDRAAQVIFDWQVAHTRHPLIGRRLRALLSQAGFTSIAVTPVAYSTMRFLEADLALELTHAAESAAQEWSDRLSLDEAQAWRAAALAADEAAHFFVSVPLYFGYGLVE
jgi:ubiquinone/menaquinone biosynthesis C-methylase UbiE